MIHWNKKVMAALLTGVMILGAAGCGDTSAESEKADSAAEAADAGENTAAEKNTTAEEAGNTELKTVRLGIPGTEDTTILLELAALAYKNGYLEEELNEKGYTIDPKYFAGAGPEINEAMAAGELDAAIYGDFPIFVTKSNGIDTTVVASVNSELQYELLTLSDEINEPKDLEGKRLIVAMGTIVQYFWERYVDEYDLDTGKIEVINATDATSLLMAGEADAYVSTSYGIESIANMGLGRVFDSGADVEGGYSTQLVTVKTDYLAENPEVAVAINKALLRTYEEAAANPQLLYDAENSANIPAEVWEKVYSYDNSLSYMEPKITDEMIAYFNDLNNWLYDNAIISEKVDVDALVDTSYYNQAVEELGK